MKHIFVKYNYFFQWSPLWWCFSDFMKTRSAQPVIVCHITGYSGVGGGGARAPPKILICQKYGHKPWNSVQKWRPTFAEKHVKTFFWRSHQKRSSWSLWRKLVGKSRTKNFSGKFGEIWANILGTSKNFSVPKPMTGYTTSIFAVASAHKASAECVHSPLAWHKPSGTIQLQHKISICI